MLWPKSITISILYDAIAIDHKLSDEEMIATYCAAQINVMYWLRGKITDLVRKSEMKYSVFLIDYGSLALLQPDQVQPHCNILLWNDNQCLKWRGVLHHIGCKNMKESVVKNDSPTGLGPYKNGKQ